jgi:Ca-activated chloride channel homolog
VLDVSGSMLTKVPTAGNRTREQVTVDAAVRGLELFDDSWAVGLWVFSTNLDGNRDYRELLPMSSMSSIRARAVQARLQQLKDPKRPVDIVFIGIGPDISEGPVQQIVATTGGGVFIAPDPADISTIFLNALALHTQPK